MKTEVKLNRAILKIEDDKRIVDDEYASFEQTSRAKARIKRNEKQVSMWKEWLDFFNGTPRQKTFDEFLDNGYNELDWQCQD